MDNSVEQASSRENEQDGSEGLGIANVELVRGSRVLVAAADSSSRWAQVGVLREAGARVAEARNGIEALDLARESRPDLVLAAAELPSLSGAELRASLRCDPGLRDVPVVLLGDSLPPTGNSHSPGRELAEAVIALVEERRVELAEQVDVPDVVAEREDLRAQSSVSMYRQPANRAHRSSHPVWRLRAPRDEPGASAVSGFGSELRVMSRILGAGFVALVVATLGLIGWQLAATAPRDAPRRAEDEMSGDAPVELEEAAPTPATTEASRRAGDVSGELREGVDASLTVGPGQGVLELTGPPEVRVLVDGIARGSLPVTLVLDQGRHLVWYEHGGARSVRFYYVKSGATRALEVITRPGGFVDAR